MEVHQEKLKNVSLLQIQKKAQSRQRRVTAADIKDQVLMSTVQRSTDKEHQKMVDLRVLKGPANLLPVQCMAELMLVTEQNHQLVKPTSDKSLQLDLQDILRNRGQLQATATLMIALLEWSTRTLQAILNLTRQ